MAKRYAIVLPHTTIVMQSELSFTEFAESIYATVMDGKPLLLNNDDGSAAVIYSHIPGAPINILTFEKLNEMRREQTLAALRSGGH